MDEEVFEKELNKYNKDMNVLIKSKKWTNLSEIKLQEHLTNIIKLRNPPEEKYCLDSSYISDLLNKNKYMEIYNELQRLFKSFIPFITIRRFIHSAENIGIKQTCDLVNKYKSIGYHYNKTMDYII